MENTILDLFENEKLMPAKIAKKVKLTTAEVREILKKYNYLTIGRTWEEAVKIKKAVEYYINNSTVTLEETSKLFGIYPDNLSKNIKDLGFQVTDRARIPQFDETIFDSIDTEEKAYWLGFIFADGYIQSKEVIQFKWIFRIGLAIVDTYHLEKFNSFMKCKTNKVFISKYHQNGIEKERCVWTCANKHLWTTLNNLGCIPNKSLVLKFPKIKQELIRHFVRGYFDGDGSLGCYGQYLQPSCSLIGTKDMLDNISKQLSFIPYIYHHKCHKEETLTMSLSSQKAIDFINYIYKDATIYLDRKYNKYIEMCRLWEKSHGLSETKIGKSCDVDPEVTKETKKSLAP